MCDYSLHHVKTKPAAIGMNLKVSAFSNTATRGMTEAGGDEDCAICMLPGTEVVFKDLPRTSGWAPSLNCVLDKELCAPYVGKFVQVDVGVAGVHHDAIEFTNGQIMYIAGMLCEQELRVLQVPADAVRMPTEVFVHATEGVLYVTEVVQMGQSQLEYVQEISGGHRVHEIPMLHEGGYIDSGPVYVDYGTLEGDRMFGSTEISNDEAPAELEPVR